MQAKSPVSKSLFVLLVLMMLAGCGTAEPSPTAMAKAPTLVPTFTPTPEPTAPFSATPTDTPTQTPLPTEPPTSTPTPVPPTNTPTGTPSPTWTPEPPSPTPTSAPPNPTPQPRPTSTPQPPTPTPTPKDSLQYDITMQRMLHIDENGGVIGNHNIWVHVTDAQGNPLDGVVICRVYALQLQPPDPHACGSSGDTGPGRMHFDVYSGDIVFVASADGEHRPLSPRTRSLEQEPAAMSDLQELVDNGYCESIDDCLRRMPINNLVRFHYSYEVHFTRRW